MKTGPLLRFVKERWSIYLKKEAGAPKPLTRDPILLNYRFTTPYREMDKVTRWIADNWRGPHELDEDVWFAMCVARYFNWPATLSMIGYPIPWCPKLIVKQLNKHVARTDRTLLEKLHKETPYKIERVKRSYRPQVFGGAYFLNSIGPKIESIVYDRLDAIWKNRKQITRQLENCETLAQVHQVFLAQHGFGSFMAAQIVADLKYTPRFSEKAMSDWWTFAASGPGSKRGLNRLCGRPVNQPWKESEWHEKLLELQDRVAPYLVKWGMPRMHAQDTQGMLCETDKLMRVQLGEGRPKTKYNGNA